MPSLNEPEPIEPVVEEPKKTDAEEISYLKTKADVISIQIKQLDDISHQYRIRQMVADSQIVSLTEDLDEAKKKMSELENKQKGVLLQ